MAQVLQVRLFNRISWSLCWYNMIIQLTVLGFYYVCVDFNPQAPISSITPSPRSTSQPASSAPASEEGTQSSQSVNSTKGEGRQRSRRDSSVRRRDVSPTPLSTPVATMSGFYYHQNSEPWVGTEIYDLHTSCLQLRPFTRYQQLSLAHVPERTSSSFEFRWKIAFLLNDPSCKEPV